MRRATAIGTTLTLLFVSVLVRLLLAQPSPAPQAPSAPPPPPPTYTLTDLGPLAITAVPGGATALNASGQVTGFRIETLSPAVCSASAANRAFLWNPNSIPPPGVAGYTELGTLTAPGAASPGASSFGYGINGSGQIAGAADICVNTGTSVQRAFVWQNGVMTALDPSTNTNLTSAALAINTNGDIAGYMNNGGYLAAIWKATAIAPSPGGAVRSNNIVTITTTSAHSFVASNAVAIAGVNDPSFDGSFTIISVPSATSFTYSQAGTDATAGSGTAWGQVMLANLSGSTQGQARAINDLGQTVGWASPPGATHAVLWDTNGQIKDLGTLPGTFSASNQANAINNNGAVAGYSQIDGATIHAFVWQNGTMTDLGTIPGANPANNNLTDTNSAAWGINMKGDVVGVSGYGTGIVVAGNGGRAFLHTGGQMYDLLTLLAPGTGWRQLEAAWAINDNGQIVGVGTDPNQQQHGFLLTPIITPTTTTLAPSVNPSVFGQQVSFTATVTPTQSSALTPTGNITFNDGGTVLGSVALSSGSATFSTTALTVGSHSITVSYAGDNNFSSSTSAALTQMVSQATTTTTLSASPNPSNVGQTVTLTATVAVVAPGAGTPTGTVTFVDGTTTLGIGLLNGAGNVTFATSSLSAGNHSITATYGGDANFSGSTTASSVTVTVQGPPPPVQITDNETITVTDTESFPDVYDAEKVHVADAVFVTPLIQVSAPVAEFSAGSLGFGGQSGSQTITVSNIGLASLTLASATISGSPQFTITQVVCSNNATSLSTALPSGGVCIVMIGYTASATPANDSGLLTFTDNAALSNLPVVASGSNYAQSIPLNGSGTTTSAPPPPPAVIPVMDNETITVTDTESFPDVVDAERVHVADTVFVTPIINVGAPVADYSAGSLGFGGQSGSQTITVSDIGQVSLTLASATISSSSQFAITQISCTNRATSLSTVLPSGGVCAVTIGYAASGTPASDNGVLVFTDNASLSNVASTLAGSTYTQSIALNGSGITTPPPPPPPAVVPVMDNETIHVTDTVSFPDVFDSEKVHVADAVFVTPLIQVSAPAAEFSAGALGFSGQSGSQTVTVSDIGRASLTLTSAMISGSSQFTITQIACSNGASSFPTTLLSGGVCAVTIGYSASATPANDNATLIFTDNAALSNLQVFSSGANYTQSIPLNGLGVTTAPPPPPPAVVPVMDNETIHVTEAESFPDVFDVETIKVTDQVLVQAYPLTTTSVSGPGVTFGTPAVATVTVSSASGLVTGNVALSVDGGTPIAMALTNGSATFNLGVLKAGTHLLLASFPVQGGFSGSNASTTLTVSQATPVITWANPVPIPYGTALSSTQLNATVSVPGTFLYTPAATTVLSAGSHTLSVTFSPADSTDYTTANASVTILVLNTIVGTNVGVTPVDTTTGLTPITVNFSNVTKAGVTNLTTGSTGAPPPPGFQPGVPLTYYDISTTATFAGTATICIHYSGTTFSQPPHLFHLENGVWVDRTTSIDPVNMIVCGTVASFSPFALFAPLPVLTITANSLSRQYGQANPSLNNVAYSGFVNGDTSSVLSGMLSCVSPATPASPVGTYPISCSGLTSPNYTIKFAPGVLTVTPAPLTVTAANVQRVYGAANPVLTGTITGVQNGDNITATYTTMATPTSPVGVYAIVPTLSDPGAKLGNYAVTSSNGMLTVVQASTTTALSVAPNPSNFGQSVTLTAKVAPVAPGAGTATGKVTFFDGSVTLGTSTLSSVDTATFTTSSLAAGNHTLTASYSGDANFSGSSSSAVSDQVQCGVLISLSSPTVPLGGTITVTGKVISCSTTTQTVVIKFTLGGPSQPNSCSSTKSVMFTTTPFPLAPKTSQTVSFPFKVPTSGVCPGTYTITAATLVNGVAVNTSTASLTITAH